MMIIDVEIQRCDRQKELLIDWEDNFEISAAQHGGEIVVSGNRAGLVSLARHLLTLAQEDVPVGSHIHLTSGQELDGDFDLILELAR